MRFISPWSLLWLALLIPVIIFFYLLKLRRREVTVSSVLLWSHVIRDMQANAPFQRLRKNLLLFLQLAIVLLAIMALARPYVMASSLGGQNVVVILDGSASMQSRDVGRSRFEEARATALQMVGQMGHGDSMMLILAAGHTQPLTHSFTSDSAALRRALRQAQPADSEADLREAIILGATVAAASVTRRGSRIYVLSDGAFENLEQIDLRGSDVRFVRIGQRSDNVGIVALDVRRPLGGDATSTQCFLAIRNYGPQPRNGSLELYRDERLIDARPVALPGADPELGFSEVAEVFRSPHATAGVLSARLDIQDDLEVDNAAYAQIAAQRDVRVLLVSDVEPAVSFLAKALNTDSHVRVTPVTPAQYSGQAEFDVVVLENVSPGVIGPGNYLFVNATGETCPAEVAGQAKQVAITDWERGHPVMRFVDLSQVGAEEAPIARPKPWGRVLAAHEGGPAIVAGERQDAVVGKQSLTFRSVYVGLPIQRSNFWRTVAFPIFISNATQWLAIRPGQTEGLQLRAGQTATIEVPDGVKRITVIDPAGQKRELEVSGRLAYYRDTLRRGVYQVVAPNFRRTFAVNLLSRRESNTKPQDKIQIGRQPVRAADRAARSPQEGWRWLALLALLVLAVEWYIYHRRI